MEQEIKQELKKIIIIVLGGLIVAFIFLFFMGKQAREREAYIKLNGIESVGTVIHKISGRGYPGSPGYGVRFEFEHNGETFRVTYPVSSRRFNNMNVGIGDRFEIRFLPCRPGRDAIILLDRPVTPTNQIIEK